MSPGFQPQKVDHSLMAAPRPERLSDATKSQPWPGTKSNADKSMPLLNHLDNFGTKNSALQHAERATVPPAKQALGLVHGKCRTSSRML